MSLLTDYFRDVKRSSFDGWNRFWFRSANPVTLAVIRILAGGMLFYTHLIWALNSNDFFGPHAWMTNEVVKQVNDSVFAWSWFHWIESSIGVTILHAAALAVFALLTLGCYTRVVSVLAFLTAVAYANRIPAAMFGLDQVNTIIAFYLMIGPCGARFSIDAWRRRRRDRGTEAMPIEPSISANIATRLLQVHLCVIYFFAGVSKLQGPAWWNGTAIWGAVANLEYQSIDLTWLADWPLTVNFLTHTVIVWELSYCIFVWHRSTRPIVLLIAVAMHAGIACCLGMITFGTAMIIANMAFVSPALIEALLKRFGPPEGFERTADLSMTVGTATIRRDVGSTSKPKTSHANRKTKTRRTTGSSSIFK